MTRSFTVKQVVYAAFESSKTRSHKEIAALACRLVSNAKTTDRSVASMKVDWKSGGNVATAPRPVGRVKVMVEALLAEGGRTHLAIAELVRQVYPDAKTTGKSVASMAVDFRRSSVVLATPEHFA